MRKARQRVGLAHFGRLLRRTHDQQPLEAEGGQRVFVQAGQPTIDVPVPTANVTVRVPNVPQLIQAAIAKVQADDFANLSSF